MGRQRNDGHGRGGDHRRTAASAAAGRRPARDLDRRFGRAGDAAAAGLAWSVSR